MAFGVTAPTMTSVLRGILWMVFATLMMAIMEAMVRHISADMHAAQIAFFRCLFGLLCMVPWIIAAGVPVALGTQKQGLYFTRALTSLVTTISWFYALSALPLAHAVALHFTNPLFATLGAALFLKEDVRFRRWAATICGFIGVLIIIRPTADTMTFGALIALISAAFGAATGLQGKVLTRSEATPAVVTYMVLWLTPLTLPPALLVWQTPTSEQLVWLMALGAVATIATFSMTHALKLVDASQLAPYSYLKMPIAAVIAIVVFDETVDIWTWIGAAVICGSSIYVARREVVIAREGRAGTQ